MLERECRRNIELIWLLECLYPDHNTIAIFRAVNRKSLVFKLFVRLAGGVQRLIARFRDRFASGIPIPV